MISPRFADIDVCVFDLYGTLVDVNVAVNRWRERIRTQGRCAGRHGYSRYEWDIAGGASFGFATVWINRSGLNEKYFPFRPAVTLGSPGGLPAQLGL